MGIESLNMPRAPADWRPSADQQRQIQADPRLRNMSRDDLYFVFNKPKTPGTQQPARRTQPQPQRQPAQSGRGGSFLDGFYAILEALQGANK